MEKITLSKEPQATVEPVKAVEPVKLDVSPEPASKTRAKKAKPDENAIDLAAIAQEFGLAFTAHETGGVFEKGEHKVGINASNYTNAAQVKRVLSSFGLGK